MKYILDIKNMINMMSMMVIMKLLVLKDSAHSDTMSTKEFFLKSIMRVWPILRELGL